MKRGWTFFWKKWNKSHKIYCLALKLYTGAPNQEVRGHPWMCYWCQHTILGYFPKKTMKGKNISICSRWHELNVLSAPLSSGTAWYTPDLQVEMIKVIVTLSNSIAFRKGQVIKMEQKRSPPKTIAQTATDPRQEWRRDVEVEIVECSSVKEVHLW